MVIATRKVLEKAHVECVLPRTSNAFLLTQQNARLRLALKGAHADLMRLESGRGLEIHEATQWPEQLLVKMLLLVTAEISTIAATQQAVANEAI